MMLPILISVSVAPVSYFFCRLDHVIDGGGIADVNAVADHLAAMRLHQLGGGVVAHHLAAAADMHFGAELEKLRRHRLAEAGATAGDENTAALEQILREHGVLPYAGLFALPVYWRVVLTKSKFIRSVKSKAAFRERDMNERITVTMIDGVADVRLVRADKMNALDSAMFEALVATTAKLHDQKGLRAVVLSGEGRAFCAGLDMGRFANMKEGDTGGTAQRDLLARTYGQANAAQQAVWGWRLLPVPVIAAVHGVAFGGGFQLALGADMRFVAPDTRMSIMEIKWGLVPDMAGTPILPKLVRDDVLRDLTYTGRIFSAQEALSYGLATRICDDPRATALEAAREIAAKNPDAIRANKRMLNALMGDAGPGADGGIRRAEKADGLAQPEGSRARQS
jgi:enoyl-CoA hydratase/carnithine racemase